MNKEDFAEADQTMQEQKNNEKWPHLWLAREECGLDVVGQCLGKPLNLSIMYHLLQNLIKLNLTK